MLKPLPLRGKPLTNSSTCFSLKWILMSDSIGVCDTSQNSHFNTNIPSNTCCGSWIRFLGNTRSNYRVRVSLFMKFSIQNVMYFCDGYVMAQAIPKFWHERVWYNNTNALSVTTILEFQKMTPSREAEAYPLLISNSNSLKGNYSFMYLCVPSRERGNTILFFYERF